MRRLHKLQFFIAFLLIISKGLNAQDFSIAGFRAEELDLTANTSIVLDQNGNKCALIKVETTGTGFTFDTGILGVSKVLPKPAEIWVYVPAGVKRFSIFHPEYGSIRDYDLGMTLQAARTYILKLKTPSSQPNSVTQQWLLFRLKPMDAIVFLEDEPLETDGGIAQKFLKFGTYRYTVKAANHHSKEGTVRIDNPDSRHELSIELLPAFGYITVPDAGTLSGATVTIDDQIIGTTPITSRQISSGQHSVLITRPKYKSFSSTISISDGQTLTIDTPLQSSFNQVTITGIEGSEIWINGSLAGKSPWTGELVYGSCLVECRKEGHRTSSKSFEFAAGSPTSITIPAPTPIYGGVSISCSPAIANVFIDGKASGETPVSINKLLVGTHTIRISKEGYGDYTQTVTISEGKTESISAKLNNSVKVTLSTSVKNADIRLDGQTVESISSIASLSLGTHTISITAPGCKPFERTFTVTQDGTNTFTFNPEPVVTSIENETITVKGVTFKMIAVQGGTFYMGSGGFDSEKPVHEVTLSSYHIGETEVTQALWEAVMGKNPSNFKDPQNPVETVSWKDCQKFISKLNSLTGKQFRLPTGAEWEYAARGGNKSRGYKYSGSDYIGTVAWYEDNSGSKTHPVKTKSPNELSIYDMSGNVYEWCNDWYGSYPSSPVSDPKGPSSASNRVYRGGSWFTPASICRVPIRYGGGPTNRGSYLGLRLAF